MKKQKKNLKSKLFKKKFNQKEKTPRLAIRFNLKKVLPKEIRLGSKVPEALDRKIEEILKSSAERAKQNHRTTLLPQDL